LLIAVLRHYWLEWSQMIFFYQFDIMLFLLNKKCDILKLN